MGLISNLFDKRKAKVVASAAPFLDAGEVPGATAICQSETQATQAALFGKTPWNQFLATATDENLYIFPLHKFKSEVIVDGMQTRPLAKLDAQMDGQCAVIGDLRFAPLLAEKKLPDMVAFVQQRSAQ
jgi:hypothetical protein